MNQRLELEVAQGYLQQILDYTTTDFQSLGVSRESMNLTLENKLWNVTNRLEVERTLESVIHGTIDAHGLNRFPLPAEYVAAVICLVAPINRKLACSWMGKRNQTGHAAQQLAHPTAQQSVDPVTAEQLFALVGKLSASTKASEVREHFNRIINGRAQKAAATAK